jgi:putative SOS response-associated peptidase YedK
MNWGLVPSRPDGSIDARMINARAETVTQKPIFKRLFKRQSCLIPADVFTSGEEKGAGRCRSGFI